MDIGLTAHCHPDGVSELGQAPVGTAGQTNGVRAEVVADGPADEVRQKGNQLLLDLNGLGREEAHMSQMEDAFEFLDAIEDNEVYIVVVVSGE